MAVLHLESWDKRAIGDLARRYTFPTGTGSFSIEAAGGRFAEPCLRCSGKNLQFSLVIPNSQEFIVAFPFKADTDPDDTGAFIRIYDGVTEHVSMIYRAPGITVWVRNGGTTLTTFQLPHTIANVWMHFAFRYKIANVGGEFQAWINGISVCNVSGLDTQNGSNAYANIVNFIINPTYRISSGMYIQDLVAPTAAYLGDKRGIARVPNGAGASAQFTPSAGANWQNVDEAGQDDDTTYNESTTPGHIDSFTKAALGITGTVSAVQLAVLGRKTDAGARTLRNKLRSGGAYYDGATRSLADSYGTEIRDVWTQNPSGPAAWDVAGVDNAEMGYELVA